MKLALLAALAVMQPQSFEKPLNEVASTAAICVGWGNLQRVIEHGLSTQSDQKELIDENLSRTFRTLFVGDITINNGRCGRPLPTSQQVKYPDDFRKPHAIVTWTTETAKHLQALIYMGRDAYGGYRFLLLTRDVPK